MTTYLHVATVSIATRHIDKKNIKKNKARVCWIIETEEARNKDWDAT